MMEWLKNKGCICDEMTFAFAATLGNIEGMMWLKVNGCPWNENTYYFAARTRNLQVLEWLKINECPMADRVFAPKCQDETIVEWFNSNGYRVHKGFGFVKIQE